MALGLRGEIAVDFRVRHLERFTSEMSAVGTSRPTGTTPQILPLISRLPCDTHR